MIKFLAAAICLAITAQVANAGSITLSYSASQGSPTAFSAAANISDADTATLLAYCQSVFTGTHGLPKAGATSAGCFQALAAVFAQQTVKNVLQWQQDQAAMNAAAAITPIVIAPQ